MMVIRLWRECFSPPRRSIVPVKTSPWVGGRGLGREEGHVPAVMKPVPADEVARVICGRDQLRQRSVEQAVDNILADRDSTRYVGWWSAGRWIPNSPNEAGTFSVPMINTEHRRGGSCGRTGAAWQGAGSDARRGAHQPAPQSGAPYAPAVDGQACAAARPTAPHPPSPGPDCQVAEAGSGRQRSAAW